MTPVPEPSTRGLASPALRIAARIVLEAAEALAGENSETAEVSRYLLVADRIEEVLESPSASRQQILLCSPALFENSGRSRTLIEMIEAEPADDVARVRLAKLLMRALHWQPRTFPYRLG